MEKFEMMDIVWTEGRSSNGESVYISQQLPFGSFRVEKSGLYWEVHFLFREGGHMELGAYADAETAKGEAEGAHQFTVVAIFNSAVLMVEESLKKKGVEATSDRSVSSRAFPVREDRSIEPLPGCKEAFQAPVKPGDIVNVGEPGAKSSHAVPFTGTVIATELCTALIEDQEGNGFTVAYSDIETDREDHE